jgi:hypothetical protein
VKIWKSYNPSRCITKLIPNGVLQFGHIAPAAKPSRNLENVISARNIKDESRSGDRHATGLADLTVRFSRSDQFRISSYDQTRGRPNYTNDGRKGDIRKQCGERYAPPSMIRESDVHEASFSIDSVTGLTIQNTGPMDVDGSDDGMRWFHFIGKRCHRSLPPWDQCRE